MTTIDTITDEQIITLGEEAGRAGDFDMVAICERAIDGAPVAEVLARLVDLMRERADLVAQVATLRAEIELSRRVADECIVRLRECEYRLADVMAEHTGTVEANEDLQREREAVAKYVASVLDDWDAAVRGLPGSSVRRLPRLRDAGRGGPDALAAAAVMASD